MSKAETRTVLLARPGDARDQLVAALEEVGLDLALVANPLEIEQSQVLALEPRNLVIAMDAEVEDALERFDDLLALPDCRILFEESDLVAARVGWDIARWSRHLSAKLLGHGDVLPAGHEVEAVPAAPARPAVQEAPEPKATPEPQVAPEFEPAVEMQAAPVEIALEPQVVDELEPTMEIPAEPAEPVPEAPIIPPPLPPAPTPVQEETERVVPEPESAAPAASQAPTSSYDYDDYDELDAFSFLDKSAIEAAIARDAEAAAIREAEAAAEAALRAKEAAADLSIDPVALDALWLEQLSKQSMPDVEPAPLALQARVEAELSAKSEPVEVSGFDEATEDDDFAALESASFLDKNLLSQAPRELDEAALEEFSELDDISFLDTHAAAAEKEQSESALAFNADEPAEALTLEFDGGSFLEPQAAAAEDAQIESAPAFNADEPAGALTLEFDDGSFLEPQAAAAEDAQIERAPAFNTNEPEEALTLEFDGSSFLEPQAAAAEDVQTESAPAFNTNEPEEALTLEFDGGSFLEPQAAHSVETPPDTVQVADTAAPEETPPPSLPSWDISAELDSAPLQSDSDNSPAASAAEGMGDWSIYQDFDAISALPSGLLGGAAAGEERSAPSEPAHDELAHEDAYQRMTDELNQFEVPQMQDSWQDFERPTAESEEAAPEPPAASSQTQEKTFGTVSQWSLSDISLTIDEGSKRPAFDNNRLEELERRISSLSLVQTEEEAQAAAAEKSHEGAVLLLGGIGGPDPLRQILQQLPKDFPVPVLVQQWLDAGSYDRLQRQMERVSALPIMLAVPGMEAEGGTVYIVPPGVALAGGSSAQLRFAQGPARDFADLLGALPGSSSVAVLLSGASDAFVDALLRFQQAGGQILAQSEEGCYDHAMPALMASRGAQVDSPSGIASRLTALWSTTELK